MTEVPPYEPLPEDWERALVIVAHPDDIEYGTAAAVARWTGQGKHVAYCLVTNGEAGIDGLPPDEAGPLREEEERAAARMVGVEQVEFLGFPDGTIEYGVPLRRAMAAAVRQHRPEIVVTINFRDTFGGVMLNQADHIATGRAVLDAVRDAGNRWVFPDKGPDKWDGVRAVWAGGSPEGGYAVDVSDTWDVGLASLRAHKAYLEGLGDGYGDPAEFLTRMAAESGERLGCRYAVAFEVFAV